MKTEIQICKGSAYGPRAKTTRREHATLAINLRSLSHGRCVYGFNLIKIEPWIVEYGRRTGSGRGGVTVVLLAGRNDSSGME